MKCDVLFNTWDAAFFIKGGGEFQLLNSKKYLEGEGVKIDLYNMWAPQTDFGIFHQFTSVPGVEYVVEAYKKRGKRIALSPVFWDKLTPENKYYSHYSNLFSFVDVFFTNSDMESELIAECFNIPREKFIKTRNSISDYYIEAQVEGNLFRDEFKIDGDYILTVANIDERKNTRRLLEACEKLGKNLISIGNVRHEHIFEEIKGNDYFHHLGPISDERILASAYKGASLFVLPSMCETPGIAALEAASQGAKIVITKDGSTTEYFKDYVTYIDPWNSDSIAEGILSEEKQDRDRIAFSQFIKENFSWKKTAEDILKGYKELGFNE